MERSHSCPSIPVEILEDITGHVANLAPSRKSREHRLQDLRNCSLASRALRKPSQKEIFRSVILGPPTAPSRVDLMKRFADLVTQPEHTHIAGYVRKLTYQPRKGRRDEDVKILTALSLFKSVEQFEFMLASDGRSAVDSDQPFFSCAWSPKSAWAKAVLAIMRGTNIHTLLLPIGCMGWPITRHEIEAHTLNAPQGAAKVTYPEHHHPAFPKRFSLANSAIRGRIEGPLIRFPVERQTMAVNLTRVESLAMDFPQRPHATATKSLHDEVAYAVACHLLSQSECLAHLKLTSNHFDSARDRFTETPLGHINQLSFGFLTSLRVDLEVLVDGPLQDPYQGFLLHDALTALISLEVFEFVFTMIIFQEDVIFSDDIPSIIPGSFEGGWCTLDRALAPFSGGRYNLSIPALRAMRIQIQIACAHSGVADSQEVQDQVESDIRGLCLVEGKVVATNFKGLEHLAREGVLGVFDFHVEEYGASR